MQFWNKTVKFFGAGLDRPTPPLGVLLAVVLMPGIMWVSVENARAQTESANGQTIVLSISSSIGTGNDLYGRLMARHLGRFLPGHPAIVPENMPGAAGVVQANWLANVARKDGSAFAIMQAGPAFDPLLGFDNVHYDPRQFHWLMSLDSLVSLAVVRDDTPLQTAKDLFTKEVIFGGSTGDSVILPSLMNDLIGTKIRLVKGYPGAGDIILAMQRGEVQGLSTYWDTVKAIRGGQNSDGGLRVLMQIVLKKHPELPEVPLVMDFIKDPENRQIMELVLARQAVGRPVVLPPGTPAEKVAQFQTALGQMVVDPQFLADAAQMKLEINITSGAELETLIDISNTGGNREEGHRGVEARRRPLNLLKGWIATAATCLVTRMQKFEIPPDLAERILARRGKRHVFDQLVASRTALLVVDLQNAYMDETEAHSFIPQARAIVAQVNGLAELLRRRGGLVVWVQNTVTDESLEQWPAQEELTRPDRRAARIRALTKGSRGHALWHELAVDPRDAIVCKTRPSAFIQGSSPLEALLRARAIDTLLVTGTNTGVCCEMTAKDAMMLGFRTIMVSDANAAADQAQHEFALLSFYRNFGDVMTSAEVKGYLESDRDPEARIGRHQPGARARQKI